MKTYLLSIVFLSISVLCFSTNSMAWTLIYANDANGNSTYGNIQTLVDSVKDGKKLRFVVEETNGSIWSQDPEWVQMLNNIVHVSFTQISKEYVGDVLWTKAAAYKLYFSLDTKGVLTDRDWYISSNTSAGYGQRTVSAKWFVD